MPVAVHWTAISRHPRPCNVYAQGLLVHCVVHGAVNGPGPWYGLMHLGSGFARVRVADRVRVTKSNGRYG